MILYVKNPIPNIVMSHKQMIHSIFDYKQDRGEIPQYHMNFNWSGKQLQC